MTSRIIATRSVPPTNLLFPPDPSVDEVADWGIRTNHYLALLNPPSHCPIFRYDPENSIVRYFLVLKYSLHSLTSRDLYQNDAGQSDCQRRLEIEFISGTTQQTQWNIGPWIHTYGGWKYFATTFAKVAITRRERNSQDIFSVIIQYWST